MKAYLFLVLSVLFALGCSSAHDDNETLPNGHYVARSGSLVISAEVSNGQCQRLTVFKDGSVFSQVANIKTTGQYPNYTYSGDDYTIACMFNGTASFSANVSGKLPILYAGGYFDVSGTYQFSIYDGVLDKNGDGILDDTQNI